MATLALSLAGQVVGGAMGGPIGATIGRALGALAGRAVDAALFGEKAPAATPVRYPAAGLDRGRGDPEALWLEPARGQHHLGDRTRGDVGGILGRQGDIDGETTARWCASFAVAFCEGEVARLGRVWADGQLLETEGLTLRFYRGTETQDVDSLIEAKQGRDGAGLSRALLPGVRAAAAGAVRQPHSQYHGGAVPGGGRARAADPLGDGDPRGDRVRL